MRIPHYVIAALTLACPQYGEAQTRPTLSDVNRGTLTAPFTDQIATQDVCSIVSALNPRYSVLAQGSGPGLSFSTTNGTTNVPYEVQWAQGVGQTSGTIVTPNTPLLNQQNGALVGGVGCLLGGRDASLIIIVRAASLAAATAGAYSGTLDILLAPQ